jgi:hypothetical protein
MENVKVYYFRAYDIERDRMIRSKRPATLGAIRALGPMMQPLMETGEEIDASHLDQDGFRRKPTTRELADIISGKREQ